MIGSFYLVYTKNETVGFGDWGSSYEVYNVVSKKTGNISRAVSACFVEIEGVSPLYRIFFSDKQLRKSELLIDKQGKVLEAVPIGRTRTHGYLIYDVR